MRWTIGVVITTATVVFAISVLLGDSDRRVNAGSVIVAEVSRAPFEPSLSVTATVIPARTVYLDAVEGGRVETVFVESGTRVDAGDTILQLSNAALLLDIINREAQLFEQRDNLRNSRLAMERNALALQNELLDVDERLGGAERDFRQQEIMRQRQLTSENAYLAARDRYETLKRRRQLTLETITQDSLFRREQVDALAESVDRIEANLAIVRRSLDNLTVRAPVSGLLTSLNAEIGESKSPGERIGQIDLADDFKLGAEIDEYYLGRIEPGQTASFDLAGQSCVASILKVYPEVQGGRFRVEFALGDSIPAGIRRGQTVHLRLGLGAGGDALTLPRGAFHQTTSGRWVFVLDAEGKHASRRPIQLGRQNPDHFEILDGLKEGERVIVSSYQAFADADALLLTGN